MFSFPHYNVTFYSVRPRKKRLSHRVSVPDVEWLPQPACKNVHPSGQLPQRAKALYLLPWPCLRQLDQERHKWGQHHHRHCKSQQGAGLKKKKKSVAFHCWRNYICIKQSGWCLPAFIGVPEAWISQKNSRMGQWHGASIFWPAWPLTILAKGHLKLSGQQTMNKNNNTGKRHTDLKRKKKTKHD